MRYSDDEEDESGGGKRVGSKHGQFALVSTAVSVTVWLFATLLYAAATVLTAPVRG